MKKYDVIAQWKLNISCNFRCPYCFSDSKMRDNSKYNKFDSANKVINFFNKNNIKFLIHMSGGEPFLYPGYIELCKDLTKKHYISVNTNLTTNRVYDFSREIDPKRVEFIHCSVHISERKRLNLMGDFVKKFRLLDKAGFNIYVTQVMYPPIISGFEKIFDYFKKKGIVVIPKVFRGQYKGKYYPQAYTQGEREKLLLFLGRIDVMQAIKKIGSPYMPLFFDEKFIRGNLSFKGLPCSAGRKIIIIMYDGAIRRCYDEDICLGNIFTGEMKLLNLKERDIL